MAIRAKVLGRETLMRNLEKITPGIAKATAPVKLEIAKEAANLISAAAPAKTGKYMESIQGGRQVDNPGAHFFGKRSRDPDACGVYADFIWRFLEWGTAPHLIKGRGKNLVFKGEDGRIVSVPSVNHPGTHAHPHVFPEWKKFKPRGQRMINQAVRGAVKASLGK